MEKRATRARFRTATLVGSCLVLAAAASAGDAPDRYARPVDALGDPLPKGAIARLGTTRLGVAGTLSFSGDGRLLVCATVGYPSEGTRVYEVPSGKELRRFAVQANAATVCSGNKTLAVVHAGGVTGFDLESSAEVAKLQAAEEDEHSSPIHPLSPDGTVVAIRENAGAGKKRLRLVRWARQAEVVRLESEKDTFEDIVWSRDGKRLAAARADGSIGIFDVSNGNEVATLVEPGVMAGPACFSPDGSMLAGLSSDSILLWDVATSRIVGRLAGCARNLAAFSHDGKLLAAKEHEKDGVVIWEVATGTALRKLTVGYVYSLAFSPTEDVLAVSRWPRSISLYEAATGRDLAPLPGHRRAVTSVAFLSDGKRLVTTEKGASIVWDLDEQAEMRRLVVPFIDEIPRVPDHVTPVVSPDEKSLIAVDWSGRVNTIVYLDLETGKVERRLDKIRATISSLAVSPDGKQIAIGAGTMVRLVDTKTGRETRILGDGQQYREVSALTFSPDGKTLALGQGDRADSIVDLTNEDADPRLLEDSVSYGARRLGFSADGKLLVGAGDIYEACIWDVTTRKKLFKLPVRLTNHAQSIAVSPDGKTVALGWSDSVVHIFETAKGTLVRQLAGHDGAITAVEFSQDSRRLATASADGTVLVWDMTRGP